jgi:hypothetical protein
MRLSSVFTALACATLTQGMYALEMVEAIVERLIICNQEHTVSSLLHFNFETVQKL